MGRPLKIQKYSTSSGVGSPGAAVGIDIGFPNFGSLTNPVVNTADTLNTTQYLGVVGGYDNTATSATNPIVLVQVNITSSYSDNTPGYVLRQKGSHKYLVATVAAIDPANAVVGVAIRIVSVGNTEWASMGAPAGYDVGTIFTPVVASSPGTSGTANEVGICVLSNAASPAAGFMSIAWIQNDSTELYLSKLTNKFMLDWTGGSTYDPAEVIADKRYAANFFTDEGTVIKSGTTAGPNTGTVSSGQQNLLDLAIIQNQV
jgi:hypothetical protein